jgi:amino acid permease
MKEADALGVIAVFAMITIIFFLFIEKIETSNLSYINISNSFMPFGVILFAYLAFSIMPEIKKILNNERKKIKTAIIVSYSITFLIYVIFTLIVLGFKGQSTPELATLALGKPFIILGMLTMFTAYLSLSVALMDTYIYDFKMKNLLMLIIAYQNTIGSTKKNSGKSLLEIVWY